MNDVLIIGGKPYTNFFLDPVLDLFDQPLRCNFSLPGYNNGTKWGQLYFNEHLFASLCKDKVNFNDFLKQYPTVKPKYLRNFYDLFYSQKFGYKQIFHIPHRFVVYNNFFAENDLPCRFSQHPRTGMVLIMESILKNKFVYVSNFSIKHERRKTYYHGDAKEPNEVDHSSSEEYIILSVLHNSGLIDLSLCLLMDQVQPTIEVTPHLKPSKSIVWKLIDVYNDLKLIY